MTILTPVFKNGGKIPSQYTCDGDNINPLLEISDVPAEAKSLALIMDDPDSPSGAWLHWSVWNIDPKTAQIPENSVPAGAVQGPTSFGEAGYGGPCPHSGTHRYFFRLYALDSELNLPAGTGRSDLERALSGHILAQAELMGTYRRQIGE
jgi:Raf kinase inhibitor-like YbhB/YbcL family protein